MGVNMETSHFFKQARGGGGGGLLGAPRGAALLLGAASEIFSWGRAVLNGPSPVRLNTPPLPPKNTHKTRAHTHTPPKGL